ncbi:MAG: transposase, partial [Oscillospiraceae bacterium]
MELPKRKNIRLKNYDYGQNGAYFITVCTKDRHEILWNVGATFGRPQESPQLSEYGTIIRNEIDRIGEIYDNVVVIDKYVIMPNHIHMIILLHGDDRRPKVAPTISRIMQQFKGSVTKQIGFSLWQKLFHDHIIRNEQEYQNIWEYIDTNSLH